MINTYLQPLPHGITLSCRSATFATMRRTDGELILWWTLPVLLVMWLAAFLLFPGFRPPMAPTMPPATR